MGSKKTMNDDFNYPDLIQHRYQLLQKLSKKNRCQTWIAQDLTTQSTVILKLFSFSRQGKWEEWRLFEREANTLKSLFHAAIPRYLDFFEVDLENLKGFALVQSYLEGNSLQTELNQGYRFTEDELKAIAISLLDVLIYLQSRQPPVIHRDLKPSNILLAPNFSLENPESHQVYLVDFGSVRTATPQANQTFTIVGTYGYMAPEQFGGQAFPATDLYSLGITLLALHTGKQPADFPQTNLKIQFEASVALSPTFTRWLQKLIEPSLDKRFTSALIAKTHLINPAACITQPDNTQISFTKNAYAIEIIIPYGKWNWRNGIALGLSSLFLMGGIIALFYIKPLLIDPTNYKVLLLLFMGSALWGLIASLYQIYGKIRLRIDNQQIQRMALLLGWSHETPEPTPTREIIALEKSPRQIIVRTRTKRYEIGNHLTLTPEEINWLAAELSSWLRLPVIDDSQTP